MSPPVAIYSAVSIGILIPILLIPGNKIIFRIPSTGTAMHHDSIPLIIAPKYIFGQLATLEKAAIICHENSAHTASKGVPISQQSLCSAKYDDTISYSVTAIIVPGNFMVLLFLNMKEQKYRFLG